MKWFPQWNIASFFPLRVRRFVSVGSDRVGRNARDGGPMNEKSIDLFQLWPWLKYWDDNVDFYLAFVRFWMPEAPHQWYTNEPGGGWICKRWQRTVVFHTWCRRHRRKTLNHFERGPPFSQATWISLFCCLQLPFRFLRFAFLALLPRSPGAQKWPGEWPDAANGFEPFGQKRTESNREELLRTRLKSSGLRSNLLNPSSRNGSAAETAVLHHPNGFSIFFFWSCRPQLYAFIKARTLKGKCPYSR